MGHKWYIQIGMKFYFYCYQPIYIYIYIHIYAFYSHVCGSQQHSIAIRSGCIVHINMPTS